MSWIPSKRGDDDEKNGADLSPPDTSSSSKSQSELEITSTPTPARSSYGAETTSDAVVVSPTTPMTPAGLMQGMFQQASNTSIKKAVFNIYGLSPPATSDAITRSEPTAVFHVGPSSHRESSRASSARFDLPTSPIPTPQTDPEIYVRHLVTKNRGYPLWIPSPNRRLPAAYRASGVGFGDVGILMPEGGFSFLFNVVHDATHPINSLRRLPEGFAPFTAWVPDDVEEYEEFSAGSYLADRSLIRMDSGNDILKTTLKSSAAEAAVLMMPESVQLSILQNIAPFRDYVRVNLRSWYGFVRKDLGREITNGDIRVVYGCRKSAAFGIATVSNSGRVDASTELTFSIDSSWIEVTGCKYRWHHGGYGEVKAGPSLKENRDLLDEADPQDIGRARVHDAITNQCLFVSTIDMPLPDDEWNSVNLLSTSQLRSSTVTQLTSPPSLDLTAPSGETTSESGGSNASQQDQRANPKPQDALMPVLHNEVKLWPPLASSKRLFHPSDIIIDFLRRAFPLATSVCLCSDNWGPGMTGSTDTVAALITNVLSFNDICEDNGMVYLKRYDRGTIINRLELVGSSTTQRLWTEWHNQHNSSLMWLELKGEPGRVLTPSFPEFVETRMAPYTSELSGSSFGDGTLRPFGGVLDSAHMATKTHEFAQGPSQRNAISQLVTTETVQETLFNTQNHPENLEVHPNTPLPFVKIENNLAVAEHSMSQDLVTKGEVSCGILSSDSHAPTKELTAKGQLDLFHEATNLPLDNGGPFIPQSMYRPHSRYLILDYEKPFYFINETPPKQFGILLKDALHSRTRQLVNRDQVVFGGQSYSASIRIEWPGHRPWSRQIPTGDSRSPPRRITLAKLARSVAKCVKRFMQERKGCQPVEAEAEEVNPTSRNWRFGDGPNDIKFEDLILVSLHHVSISSWQPQLRLARVRAPHHHTAPAFSVHPEGRVRVVPFVPGPSGGLYSHLAPYYYHGTGDSQTQMDTKPDFHP